ncbi:MAG: NfeD family protein [Acidobacteriota bacterium]
MDWWIWLLVGLACLALEVMTPGGIIMLFFGVAAGVVGVLTAAGLGGPLWFQVLLFSVIAIVSLLTLRGPIIRRMQSTEVASAAVDNFVGETAVVLEPISPGAIGKAELRGTGWSARNVGSSRLSKGQRCTVWEVDGLQLSIGPAEGD